MTAIVAIAKRRFQSGCGRKKTTIKYVTRTITYNEVYAVCQFCGKEVYDPKVADMNVRRRAFALSVSQA